MTLTLGEYLAGPGTEDARYTSLVKICLSPP